MNYCYLFALMERPCISDFLYTCINTLDDINIILASDKEHKDINCEYIPVREYKNKRLFLRYKILGEVLNNKKDGDIIMSSDLDIYYKTPDMFNDLPNHDLLVTTRHYKHKFIINSGVFFIRANNNTRKLFNEDFINWSKGKNLDWLIDQNYLIYLYKKGIAKDIGPNYNYCPATDKVGFTKAKEDLIKGFNNPEIKALHLKSELKKCLYEGWLPKAITKGEYDGTWQ